MDKSRQRKPQKKLNVSFIKHSKLVWYNELIVWTLTVLVWIYCLTVLYYFVDSIFNINHEYATLFRTFFNMNINEVRDFIILAVVIFLGIFSITFMWSYYNKIRYRNKYRRTYPKMTTKEDLLELNILDEKDYEQLQNEKVIVFEKNPIKLVERK